MAGAAVSYNQETDRVIIDQITDGGGVVEVSIPFLLSAAAMGLNVQRQHTGTIHDRQVINGHLTNIKRALNEGL